MCLVATSEEIEYRGTIVAGSCQQETFDKHTSLAFYKPLGWCIRYTQIFVKATVKERKQSTRVIQ